MAKSAEKLPIEDSLATNTQHENLPQEINNDNQRKSEEELDPVSKMFIPFEKLLETEIFDHQAMPEYIKKRFKKLRSLVTQHQKKREGEKRYSLFQRRWHSERQTGEMSEHIEKHILVSPMMRNLQLSYDVLPSMLKLCCLCLAIFPEQEVIKKRPIIHWWNAERFITTSPTKTAQQAGDEIFEALLNRGLVQRVRNINEDFPIMNNFTVHPWIRRMLISKASEAEFFDFDREGRVTNVDKKSHCFCLSKDNKESSSSRKLKVTTIFNVNESYLSFNEEFFRKFEKLRILQVGRWKSDPYHHIEVESDKFLNDLQLLKDLKYLSLRGISTINTLPSSIRECQNMEILDLNACHNLESLPTYLGTMKKLTHLDISHCYCLTNMPNDLEELSSLQVLKGFKVVGRSSSSGSTRLRHLASLKRLRKLSLMITSMSEEVQTELSKLSAIENLQNLTMVWNENAPDDMDELDFFSNPEFLGRLEKLDLRRVPFKKRPIWLIPHHLKNLKRLYITGGKLEELILEFEESVNYPPWKVEVLRLKHLKNLQLNKTQVEKNFPELINDFKGV